MSHVYCSKCGALLVKDSVGAETTMSWAPEEGGGDDDATPALEEFGVQGPALVVRSGGGRAGETFQIDAERTIVGRSPDCEIFLDDVTVSRKHATILRRGDRVTIEDQSSLNGTFVNRRRVESAPLEDGDELQIGKYRLTFLSR